MRKGMYSHLLSHQKSANRELFLLFIFKARTLEARKCLTHFCTNFALGLGDPAYFYVTFVFVLNGAMMSLFFIYGTYLR